MSSTFTNIPKSILKFLLECSSFDCLFPTISLFVDGIHEDGKHAGIHLFSMAGLWKTSRMLQTLPAFQLSWMLIQKASTHESAIEQSGRPPPAVKTEPMAAQGRHCSWWVMRENRVTLCTPLFPNLSLNFSNNWNFMVSFPRKN